MGKTGQNIIKLLIGAALAGALVDPAAAQSRYKGLTKAEASVCKDLDGCVDLLLAHDLSEFDYAALGQGFAAASPRSAAKLTALATGKSEKARSRALQILAQTSSKPRQKDSDRLAYPSVVPLAPAQQSALAKAWPLPNASAEDIENHILILGRNGSPDVLDALTASFEHPNPDIAKAARGAMQPAIRSTRRPPSEKYFAAVARGALAHPNDLYEALALFPPSKTRVMDVRMLRSGAPVFVKLAYARLYQTDPKMAFSALEETLDALTDDDAQAGLAIGRLLHDRHLSRREDGFYLKFARFLSQDMERSAAARLAGYSAILATTSPPKGVLGADENGAVFGDHPAHYESYKTILRLHDFSDMSLSPFAALQTDQLISGLAQSAGTQPDRYFRAVDLALGDTPSAWGAAWYLQFAGSPSPLITEFAKRDLRESKDYRAIVAGALTLGARGEQSAALQLKGLSTLHPVTQVRVAASKALEFLKETPEETALQQAANPLVTVTLKAAHAIDQADSGCALPPALDLRKDARAMPFFEAPPAKDYEPLRRWELRTASPLKSGWIAGYMRSGDPRGLVYYPYAKTATPEPLLAGEVFAILPVSPPPLGQQASVFWVLQNAQLGFYNDNLYRAELTSHGFDIRLHAVLPDRLSAVHRAKGEDDITLSFAGGKSTPLSGLASGMENGQHAPLRLSPSGAIVRACETAKAVLRAPAKSLSGSGRPKSPARP